MTWSNLPKVTPLISGLALCPGTYSPLRLSDLESSNRRDLCYKWWLMVEYGTDQLRDYNLKH